MVKLTVNLRPNLVDLAAALVGFGLLVYGISRVSVAAAFIVAGVTLITGAVARRRPAE